MHIKNIKNLVLTILSAGFLLFILVLLILRLFFMQNYVVNAGSMNNALMHGDNILCWKLVSFRGNNSNTPLFHVLIKRKDVVIIHVPGETEILIKRVIGLPGDVVELRDSHLFINNTLLKEEYITEKMNYQHNIYYVPDGKLFVLGDKRKNSRDSREFGFLETGDVKGKVFLIYFPFHRIRWFF